MRACELLEPEYLVQMLKAVKHLSMNGSLLEVLQNANAIEILVRILDEHNSSPHSTVLLLDVFYFYRDANFKHIGNCESYLPDMLFALPTQQSEARRSCSGWYNPMLETSHGIRLASQTIRSTHPL